MEGADSGFGAFENGDGPEHRLEAYHGPALLCSSARSSVDAWKTQKAHLWTGSQRATQTHACLICRDCGWGRHKENAAASSLSRTVF